MCVVSRACNHIERVISHGIDNDEGLRQQWPNRIYVHLRKGGNVIDRFGDSYPSNQVSICMFRLTIHPRYSYAIRACTQYTITHLHSNQWISVYTTPTDANCTTPNVSTIFVYRISDIRYTSTQIQRRRWRQRRLAHSLPFCNFQVVIHYVSNCQIFGHRVLTHLSLQSLVRRVGAGHWTVCAPQWVQCNRMYIRVYFHLKYELEQWVRGSVTDLRMQK